MTVIRPRTRLVYFRVSEDEYAELNRLCAASGARSISDLTRRAIQTLLDGMAGGGRRDRPDYLAERIDRLTVLVESLEERLRSASTVSRV